MNFTPFIVMTVIIFNFAGLAMLAIGFGIAFGLGHVFGLHGEEPRMIIAAPLLLIMDCLYRWKHPLGHWFNSSGGGSLFFLPVWMFGILWTILGIVYTVQAGGF